MVVRVMKTLPPATIAGAVLRDINETVLPRQTFVAFAHATRWLGESGGDIHAYAETASDFFDHDPQQASAALFRMQALARLVHQEPLPGWTSEAGDDGSLLIDERLFAAVAETPLSLSEGRVVFNRDRLLQTAFALGSRTRSRG